MGISGITTGLHKMKGKLKILLSLLTTCLFGVSLLFFAACMDKTSGESGAGSSPIQSSQNGQASEGDFADPSDSAGENPGIGEDHKDEGGLIDGGIYEGH